MPVFSRRFLDKNKDPEVGHLQRVGPRLQVEISIPAVLAAHLVQAGKPIPPPIPGFALVDTGASSTAVDEAILQQLGLNPIGQAQVSTPHGVQARSLYPAKLIFPGTPMPELTFQAVIGAILQNQGYLALIGRDILSQMILIYNGPAAHISFAF